MTTAAPALRRIHEIDAVRGFALAGILVANIGFFAEPGVTATMATLPLGADPVGLFVETFVLSKFYVIFSFLFGYSFTLQMRSWGDRVKARMVRRCVALFALGALQGFLFWIGDILTLYAALGLILLLMRNIQPRTAVKIGCWILGVTSMLWLALGALTMLAPETTARAGDPAAAARVLELVTSGPLGVLQYQAETYPMLALFIWLVQGPSAMALFLFGLAAGKSRLFEEPERWSHLVPRILWMGYGVALPCAIFFTWASQSGESWQLIGMALNTVTSPLLAAAYVVTLLLLIKQVPAVGAALAPAGKAAASNYIGQGLLGALVFTGYGLALAGKLAPIAVMGVAAVIYTILLLLSAWWMRNHRYGPIEWGLRAFTQYSASPQRLR